MRVENSESEEFIAKDGLKQGDCLVRHFSRTVMKDIT